ncbi:MAG: LysR substrate-binding domain-containing protein [Gammaproteobacteria bacterium]|nr:LysR substrate-binding domain-containing protein [Gammaproteobacteria bacterium]
MPVTLRQLRYFQALVEHGSFSRAAESVHVSQPALSLQIRELETSLGGRLVERESRGFLLTPLGRDAHEQTLRILDETLLLETMGKRFEEGPLRVAVGIVSTLAPYLVPGILERLQTSSPRVELDVLEAPGQELVSGLLAGRLDAAIVSLPLGILELPERELFEDCFLLAGRTERLAAIRRALGDELRPADLARADIGPLLTLGNGHCFADQVLGASLMWRMQEVHRGTESLATLSRLVASGAGLALLPETAALCEHAASPGLRFLRFSAPQPSRRIGLAHRVAAHGQLWIDLLSEAAAGAGRDLVRRANETICAGPSTSRSRSVTRAKRVSAK